MKIKISDMFDNAAEIVEAESNYNNVIDSRKIKEIVFLRIHRSRRKRVKRQCIAVLIAVLGLSVISAGAKTLLQSAGVIGINKEDVLQSQVGINIDEDKLSTSGSVQMGYINNSGTKTGTYSGTGSSHSTSFTISTTGYYRFYVTNQSSSTLQITGGTISF